MRRRTKGANRYAMRKDGVIHCIQDVHVRDLIKRAFWSIDVRWFFVAACFLIALLAYANLLPTLVSPNYFIAVGIFLLVVNSVFWFYLSSLDADCAGTHEMRSICFAQIFCDYVALAVVTYATGSVETPIMFLVIPDIVLAALFFRRKQSVLITVMGLALITLPLNMELQGVIPVVTIFENSFKPILMNDPRMLTVFMLVLVCCVFFTWYLVSAITRTLVRSELELEDNYRAMIELDEEKTKATLRGTHELKAPLAAIKSYVYTLRDGYAGEVPDKAKAVIERIGERCDRLMAKITDIIRLSNLKTFVYTGDQLQQVELLEFMAQQIEQEGAQGRHRGIEVKYHARASVPVNVFANEEHLHTLFSNLISNAVNYSLDNGLVEVTLHTTKKRAVVCVIDHGIGIPEEALPNIFGEHYRATNAVDHHANGTGLGLPIVGAIGRLLNAKLKVESKVGEGTRFKVSLPLKKK